jgi:hypothetical protein
VIVENPMDGLSQPADGRRFVFSRIHSLSSWPTDANIPGEQFCLLLLCGDALPDAAAIEAFASRALTQGMVYLSVWGRAPHRIEEVVDEVYVDTAAEERSTLVTTAHTNLDEAIAFFENDVRPPKAQCHLWWVVAVGDDDAAERTLSALESRRTVGRLAC